MSYYAGNVDCTLPNLTIAQLGDFRDEAVDIEDWRTCDEIDLELRSRD